MYCGRKLSGETYVNMPADSVLMSSVLIGLHKRTCYFSFYLSGLCVHKASRKHEPRRWIKSQQYSCMIHDTLYSYMVVLEAHILNTQSSRTSHIPSEGSCSVRSKPSKPRPLAAAETSFPGRRNF